MRRCLGMAAAMGFAVTAGISQPTSATKADSGWVALFNGVNFNGFYIFSSVAPQVTTNLTTQTIYQLDSGRIHSPRLAGEFHLITTREYSFYKVRLDYRWGPITGGNPAPSQNAGMVIHIDNTSALSGAVPVGTLRPKSIEVQMLRPTNQPFTLWSSTQLGPYINTTVQTGTPNYLPAGSGGVPWTNDPWGSRTIFTTVADPEYAVGQWNHGEADVYGADSGSFFLNGVLRTRGWTFQVRVNIANPTPRVAYGKGGIGIQQEDNEIWYRNYEIMELDSVTLIPINARRGCTSRTAANYDPRAVVDNASCSATAIRLVPGLKSAQASPKGASAYNVQGRHLRPHSRRYFSK